MNQQKGIVPLIGIIVVIAVALGVVAIIPGGFGSLVAAITPGVPMCNDAPLVTDCECNPGFEKIQFSMFGVPRFICESEVKVVDIDTPGWESDAITFAQGILVEQFPQCDMNSCANGGGQWFVTSGHRNFQERVVSVECLAGPFGERFSNAAFTVAEGNVISSTCVNFQEPTQEQSTASITLAQMGPGFNRATFWFTTDCAFGVPATGVTTFNLPASEGNVQNWRIFSGPTVGTCEISSSTQNSAVLTCTDVCTTHAGSNSQFQVMWDDIFIPNVCGNGVVEGNEQCDDGNLINGDGCTSTCNLG